MSKQAVEVVYNGSLDEQVYSGSAQYDSTKLNLGNLIGQWQLSAAPDDQFMGPPPIAIARPTEQSVLVPGIFPDTVNWSSTYQWVFLADNAAASASRRIQLYKYNKTNASYNWQGFITAVAPTAGNQTVKSFRSDYQIYTTGSISVASGSSNITGSGTTWVTDGMCVGNRIGFGTSDPTQVTSWYEIASIPNDRMMTVTTPIPSGSVTSGSSYVIEDLRFILGCTNATPASGGLWLIKGVNYGTFAIAGLTIPAATTVDNIRATYQISDNITACTNVTNGGLGLDDRQSWQTEYCYSLESVAGAKLYKYNLRQPFTGLLVAGTAHLTGSAVVVTGPQILTGTPSANNSCVLATPRHGPGSGSLGLYLVSPTRVYRSDVNSQITSGNVSWVNDNMTEVPPGSANTYGLTSVFNMIRYSKLTDRFVVLTTGATAFHSYVTKYNTIASQMDNLILLDTKQINQVAVDTRVTIHPNTLSEVSSIDLESGYGHLVFHGLTATTNWMYGFGFGAHWTMASASFQRAITPAINTPGCTKFYRVYTNQVEQLNDAEIGQAPDAYRVYYRTSGISDDSGAWTLLGNNGSLSGVGAASQIQLMYEFSMWTFKMLPARILSSCVVYENTDSLPSSFEWNINNSDTSVGTIGFNQVTLLGTGSYALQIDYYREDTNANVLTQTSYGTSNGVFEVSSSGAWTAFISGADSVGSVMRFRPTAGLPTNTNVYMKVQVL